MKLIHIQYLQLLTQLNIMTQSPQTRNYDGCISVVSRVPNRVVIQRIPLFNYLILQHRHAFLKPCNYKYYYVSNWCRGAMPIDGKTNLISPANQFQ